MVIIKRYPNRKLYNTEARQYITLEGIADLIRAGNEVQVTDHASGDDLTALTLTQIILEQEKKQVGLMSNSFLTGLIRAGNDRINAIQRSLPSPVHFVRQIDDEIKQRIQSLVQQGDLSEKEGKRLIDKLVRQSARRVNDLFGVSDARLEAALRERGAPTQADIEQINTQVEELSRQIQALAGERDDFTDAGSTPHAPGGEDAARSLPDPESNVG